MQTPTYITGTIQTTAYRILRDHVRATLSKRQLTPTSWSLLGIIAQANNGVRQIEITQALHMKPPQVTLIVRRLEKDGYIRRAQNQFDARAKLLVLTPKGKRFLRSMETQLTNTLGVLLDGLSEHDLLAYQKVLKTIIANHDLLQASSV